MNDISILTDEEIKEVSSLIGHIKRTIDRKEQLDMQLRECREQLYDIDCLNHESVEKLDYLVWSKKEESKQLAIHTNSLQSLFDYVSDALTISEPLAAMEELKLRGANLDPQDWENTYGVMSSVVLSLLTDTSRERKLEVINRWMDQRASVVQLVNKNIREYLERERNTGSRSHGLIGVNATRSDNDKSNKSQRRSSPGPDGIKKPNTAEAKNRNIQKTLEESMKQLNESSRLLAAANRLLARTQNSKPTVAPSFQSKITIPPPVLRKMPSGLLYRDPAYYQAVRAVQLSQRFGNYTPPANTSQTVQQRATLFRTEGMDIDTGDSGTISRRINPTLIKPQTDPTPKKRAPVLDPNKVAPTTSTLPQSPKSGASQVLPGLKFKKLHNTNSIIGVKKPIPDQEGDIDPNTISRRLMGSQAWITKLNQRFGKHAGEYLCSNVFEFPVKAIGVSNSAKIEVFEELRDIYESFASGENKLPEINSASRSLFSIIKSIIEPQSPTIEIEHMGLNTVSDSKPLTLHFLIQFVDRYARAYVATIVDRMTELAVSGVIRSMETVSQRDVPEITIAEQSITSHALAAVERAMTPNVCEDLYLSIRSVLVHTTRGVLSTNICQALISDVAFVTSSLYEISSLIAMTFSTLILAVDDSYLNKQIPGVQELNKEIDAAATADIQTDEARNGKRRNEVIQDHRDSLGSILRDVRKSLNATMAPILMLYDETDESIFNEAKREIEKFSKERTVLRVVDPRYSSIKSVHEEKQVIAKWLQISALDSDERARMDESYNSLLDTLLSSRELVEHVNRVCSETVVSWTQLVNDNQVDTLVDVAISDGQITKATITDEKTYNQASAMLRQVAQGFGNLDSSKKAVLLHGIYIGEKEKKEITNILSLLACLAVTTTYSRQALILLARTYSFDSQQPSREGFLNIFHSTVKESCHRVLDTLTTASPSTRGYVTKDAITRFLGVDGFSNMVQTFITNDTVGMGTGYTTVVKVRMATISPILNELKQKDNPDSVADEKVPKVQLHSGAYAPDFNLILSKGRSVFTQRLYDDLDAIARTIHSPKNPSSLAVANASNDAEELVMILQDYIEIYQKQLDSEYTGPSERFPSFYRITKTKLIASLLLDVFAPSIHRDMFCYITADTILMMAYIFTAESKTDDRLECLHTFVELVNFFVTVLHNLRDKSLNAFRRITVLCISQPFSIPNLIEVLHQLFLMFSSRSNLGAVMAKVSLTLDKLALAIQKNQWLKTGKESKYVLEYMIHKGYQPYVDNWAKTREELGDSTDPRGLYTNCFLPVFGYDTHSDDNEDVGYQIEKERSLHYDTLAMACERELRRISVGNRSFGNNSLDEMISLIEPSDNIPGNSFYFVRNLVLSLITKEISSNSKLEVALMPYYLVTEWALMLGTISFKHIQSVTRDQVTNEKDKKIAEQYVENLVQWFSGGAELEDANTCYSMISHPFAVAVLTILNSKRILDLGVLNKKENGIYLTSRGKRVAPKPLFKQKKIGKDTLLYPQKQGVAGLNTVSARIITLYALATKFYSDNGKKGGGSFVGVKNGVIEHIFDTQKSYSISELVFSREQIGRNKTELDIFLERDSHYNGHEHFISDIYENMRLDEYTPFKMTRKASKQVDKKTDVDHGKSTKAKASTKEASSGSDIEYDSESDEATTSADDDEVVQENEENDNSEQDDSEEEEDMEEDLEEEDGEGEREDTNDENTDHMEEADEDMFMSDGDDVDHHIFDDHSQIAPAVVSSPSTPFLEERIQTPGTSADNNDFFHIYYDIQHQKIVDSNQPPFTQ